MPSILIINGPNLNLLGSRDIKVYGQNTLADIEQKCQAHAEKKGIELCFDQSNHEGKIVDLIQQASHKHNALIINAGGFTHTSVAIRDALEVCKVPSIEVHISNISARESFRHNSLLSPVASGVIFGFGINGYTLAITALHDYFLQSDNDRNDL